MFAHTKPPCHPPHGSSGSGSGSGVGSGVGSGGLVIIGGSIVGGVMRSRPLGVLSIWYL